MSDEREAQFAGGHSYYAKTSYTPPPIIGSEEEKAITRPIVEHLWRDVMAHYEMYGVVDEYSRHDVAGEFWGTLRFHLAELGLYER